MNKRLWLSVRLGGAAYAAVMLALGSGCRPPSEKVLYRIARDAVMAEAALPEGAEVGPRRQAVVQAAKNAAYVRLPVQFVTDRGDRRRVEYVVWLKRVARRWEHDRHYPLER